MNDPVNDPGDVTIRLATPEDADELVPLHHACWREAYAGLLPDHVIEATFADVDSMVAQRRTRLADPAARNHVAVLDGVLVGFSSAGPARLDDAPAALELYALYARASVWGRGVGHALAEASVGGEAAYLWVLAGNDRAIGFYERHGFVADGVVDERFEGRELRMVRA